MRILTNAVSAFPSEFLRKMPEEVRSSLVASTLPLPTSASDAPTPYPSSVSSPNAPTPPSSPPDEFDRGLSLSFQSSLGCSEAEPVEDYRPGGFHPVHFGDLLHHEQYKIVGKLGFGSFSTAWLAKDTLYSKPSSFAIHSCFLSHSGPSTNMKSVQQEFSLRGRKD